jgi:predicted secreted protein
MAATQAKLSLATVLGIAQQTTLTGGVDYDCAVAAGGTGYSVGEILTVVQSGASGATFQVMAVSGGAVTQIRRLTAGTGYSVASGLATTCSGAGSGCTITINHVLWPIGEVESIGGPKEKSALVDCTNLGSPSGWAEYIVGVIDGGEISITGNLTTDAGQAQMEADLQARTVRTWEIGLPSGLGAFTASAYVSEFAADFKTKSQLTFSAMLRVTGVVTFTTSMPN